MASPATHPEASEVRRRGRQRLIGAITLVMLLVVFVPMLLDSEPRSPRNAPALEIPSRDNAPPLPATPAAPAQPAPAPQQPAAATTPAAATPPAATPTSAASEPAKVTPQTAQPVPAKAEPAPAASPAAAPKLEGFAVQVGAFRDEAKLRQAREKLTAAKVVHYTERLETKSGPLTRLRAGPFPTREAAEGALVTIKRAALDGKVVPLQ